MLSLTGMYHNGELKLEQEIDVQKPVKVIVTFLEEEELEEADQEDLAESYLTLIAFSTTHPQDSWRA